MRTFDKLLAIRQGGQIRRYHTERMITHQTNAAHQWGVAMLMLHCFPDLTTHTLMLAALMHDVAEGYVGDMPAYAKWRVPALRDGLIKAESEVEDKLGITISLSSQETGVLWYCDYLEAAFFCMEEICLGNRNAVAIFWRLHDRLTQHEMHVRCDYPVLEMLAEVVKNSSTAAPERPNLWPTT